MYTKTTTPIKKKKKKTLTEDRAKPQLSIDLSRSAENGQDLNGSGGEFDY